MRWVSQYANPNFIKTDFIEGRSTAYAKSTAFVDDLGRIYILYEYIYKGAVARNVTCSSPFSCAKKIIPGLECPGIRCRI